MTEMGRESGEGGAQESVSVQKKRTTEEREKKVGHEHARKGGRK